MYQLATKKFFVFVFGILLLKSSSLSAQEKGSWNYKSQYLTVDSVKIHYVKSGSGLPILLLHGFPETMYTWRYIIPGLSKNHTVIAIDLPGIGQSGVSLTGYDQQSIAKLLHKFMTRLGYDQTALVAHDLGVELAYGYVCAYPKAVTSAVFLDVPVATEEMKKLTLLSDDHPVFWWFAFHNVVQLPEALIKGKENIYLQWFFHHDTYNKENFNQKNIKVYFDAYAKPGVFHAAMEYYRSFMQNIKLNKENIKRKLEMPVLALGGEKSFGIKTLLSFQQIANNATGGVIENSGHFIQEEQPHRLLAYLNNFLKK